MKIYALVFSFILLASCNSEHNLEKQYFPGDVVSSLVIISRPDDDKIKSISIKLKSGELINVFIEDSFVLENGTSVRVFNYNDGSKMYYLDKNSITK